ncbi:LacI family DNA-binding transcriptional regulator [Paeniglutamicibacter sp. MACA_103]|uniref:LacI family DNA-binding transcriptional regulator n=1 Tax=Paeniglutamicibacter sp. MACA_103 TaxID=3377337 RepID=UPI003893FF61
MSNRSVSPATMLDVAAKAGVSRATVSRVFTAPESVAESTRERVMAAVDQLSYTLNTAARQLRNGRSRTIALLVGDISQPFQSQLAKSVAHAAESRGYSVLLCDLDHNIDRLHNLLRILPLQGVDGIMLATADDVDVPKVRAAIDTAERNGTRVLVGTAQLGSSSAIGWATDYASIAFQATKHLLDQGIWPIVMLGGNENSVVGRLLRRGYIQACTQSGLPEKETECVYTGLTPDSARVQADKILESENPPSGFVTTTVPIALGVMAALADKKLDIPREVSLVACEDVRLAEQLKPTLTTAGTDIDAQGQTMSLALIDAIEGHPTSLRSLETRLTVRESSRYPSVPTATPDA